MKPATRAWLVALLGWTTLLCFYRLDDGARFEPIDCWVAQTAREMYEVEPPRGLLVPVFSGETRMQKSPGPYWAVMLTAWLRGQLDIDEVSARIPSALAAIVLVLTIFWLTRRIAGDRAAVFAGFAASSSVLILWWSHRGASDLGLTTFTTLSLASLWIASETEPPGAKRNGLFLLGYFTAGLGMLYKMPMPLVVVGAPAFFYVLLRNRWSVLVNRWHLVGLLLFLLPWLPWAIAVGITEEAAFWKWKVEFLDRFTGALPNVAGQDRWYYLFTYLAPTALYTLPFTLSLPAALARAFRAQPGVNRSGTLFMVIWFASLLVFFTASTGKEERYFLPAIPPLFVLLGIELARFFNPQRPARPARDWVGTLAVWILVPAGLLAAGMIGVTAWFKARGQLELEGLYAWGDVWAAFAVTAVIIAVGFCLAAWLYRRRHEHASFATMVITMWAMWLWAWPNFLPLFMSQRPFTDFAQQMERKIPTAYRPHIRQVGTQDARIIWYSDIRFPRVIDQLALLRKQNGKRDLEYETHRVGEEMVRMLESSQLVLFVASLPDYLRFMIEAPPALAAEGRPMPPVHLWLQARYGDLKRQFVMFGNRPPPFHAPELRVTDKLRARLARVASQPARSASQPATQPADPR